MNLYIEGNMRTLLIDDDVNLSKILGYQLEKIGHEVVTAHDGREGLTKFKKDDFDIVISDIQMPDISGIQVLQDIRRINRQVPIILITAYGSIDSAMEACNLGADDYITKPFSQEQLLFVIEKTIRFRKLQQENVELHNELVERHQFDNLVAKSAKMQEVMRLADRVAKSDATVLILGESGTGKELVARDIHYNSTRKEKSIIVVNSPSIHDNLLESELFGHVKGAYTGAIKDRKGKFELADGGTIFLDEIGDLRSEVQAKLLRVLQEQEIEPLGSSKTIKVDVRVISATNKDLDDLVKAGKFREDLYYRLNVVPILIPPLRDRKEEIPFLVDFFVERYGKGKRFEIDPDFINTLMHYDWPGNVRELENVVERAVVLAVGNCLTQQELPSNLLHKRANLQALDDAFAGEELSLKNIEKTAIIEALRRSKGNRSKAARILDIPRHVLLYRLKKFELH
jgi:two-component system NtrC family response regulator